MSSNRSSFRCPVCRARQELREQCRRCQADLELVVRAHRRVQFLLDLRSQAESAGDQQAAEEVAAELQLLAPAAATDAAST